MSASTSWHAWRLACLPYAESVLGRYSTNVKQRCRNHPVKAARNLRTVHHVTNSPSTKPSASTSEATVYTGKEVKDRMQEIENSGIEQYPRINSTTIPNVTVRQIVQKYSNLNLTPGVVPLDEHKDTVAGRINSIRRAGSGLAFIDIDDKVSKQKIQIVLNLKHLESISKSEFVAHNRLIRRGDVVSVTGLPYMTANGERSLLALVLPTIVSPCLHTIPLPTSSDTSSSDIELLDRHVEMLVDPTLVETLVTRSKLLKTMRDFFDDHGFNEVQTPILAAAAGGANARPFETTATEFSKRKLALRVAPELWLKRLIVGGMSKVFEIGPSFRNEGLDKTHNPEFTTCEFYATYHSLQDLQTMTENLLRAISKKLETDAPEMPARPPPSFFEASFSQIDFIPAINAHLPTPLPNLTSTTAYANVHDILKSQSIPLPSKPTLPRLLDKLCSHYLEPNCNQPTWIINIPECLSPLAKSYIHPTAPNNQRVAARAELFINHREIVNCYEEENSPFEQRRKFLEQQHHARAVSDTNSAGDLHDDEAMPLDEDYLRALEWGLPPTGGWGCGIDRLVMLFTGKQRIGDVLSFGNLRAVTRGAERYDSKVQVGGEESVH